MKPTPIFSRIQTGAECYDDVDKATYGGISLKTFIFFALTMAVAVATSIVMTWAVNKSMSDDASATMAIDILIFSSVGAIVAIIFAAIVAIIGRISDSAAKVCIFIYSILEGFALGFVTGIIEAAYPGYYLGSLAVFGTVVIFMVMLLLFATGILRVGGFFRRFIFAVLISAVALGLFTILFIVISGIMNRFNSNVIWLILLVEVIYLLYACLTLTYNFNEAQMVVQAGCRKKSEWSVALGMLISLAYIYIQLLRVLLILVQIFGKRN